MRVYQRKGVWYIDYSFNGRRVRKKVGTWKRMAELALKEIELKIAKGEFLGIVEPKKVLFDKLCEEYLVFSQANKTPKSYERDTMSIKSLLKNFGGKMISEITSRELERYKSMRRDEVKPATVNRELSCIKHMFTKAVHWGYLPANPTKSVLNFKEPPGRVRYLTDDEIDRLLYCCARHIKPIVITALNTGMRKGEIIRLKWFDVDMVNRIITVRNSKNNESRHIPINDTLYAELLKLQSDSAAEQHVFVGKTGEPIRYFEHAFEGARKRAKIKDFRFHDLRHTFASHLVMNGVDIRVVQDLLGHRTITMTMRYSHLSNRALKDAVDKLKLSGYSGSQDGTNLAQAVSTNRGVPAKH